MARPGSCCILQYRAITTLQSQNQVIVRQISEQTAVDIAGELRRTLDGPVLDTLTAVNQPDLRAGRFDLVAQQYAKGLEAYPHVDRFLAWSTETEATTPGEVLFYGRDGRFDRDPALGRAVVELARRHAPTQHIYVAGRWCRPRPAPAGSPARVLDRRAAARLLRRARPRGRSSRRCAGHLFAEPQRARLDALLARRAGDTPLRLRVTDEHGALVYGNADAGTVSGRVAFPMLFYPADEIQSRMSGRRGAAAVVDRSGRAGAGGRRCRRQARATGPRLLSVALMLVALA